MKIALIHDYLIQDGGAERVLRVLQDIWPKAPTFALLYDRNRAHPAFRNRDIRTSFLQSLPFATKCYQWLLPLMPAAVERLDLSDFDVVLSSSSAFAKGVLTKPGTLHIAYCHTPTRYLWNDTVSYVNELRVPRPVRETLPLFLPTLRLWDRLSADRADFMVANSKTVQERIRKYYRRESDLIHPPVDVADYAISPRVDNYYLAGGRLVSYKRFDLVVAAFNKLGIPLKIFGDGPEEAKLRAMAKPNIEFLGRVAEKDKAELYSRAIAFLHPQEEDFGITAIEAMASGRPVIAFPRGGALETVIPGVTGSFFEEQTWENLAHAIIRFSPEQFQPERIRSHALQFSTEAFKEKIRTYVEKHWNEFSHAGQRRLFPVV